MTSKRAETFLNHLKDQSHVFVIAQIEYNKYLAPVLQWNIFRVSEHNLFSYILKSWNKMWFKIYISERWTLKISVEIVGYSCHESFIPLLHFKHI